MVEQQRDEEDLRVQRTKYILREALAKLLEQNELKDISIQQISKQAMTYRTTLYSHYSDKYDLLEDYLMDNWKKEMKLDRVQDLSKLREEYWEGIHDTVKFFKRYSKLFTQLNESRPIITSRNLIYTTIKTSLELLLNAIQPDDAKIRIAKDRISEFYTSGYLSVVLNWLKSKTKESIKSITEDLFNMTFENLYLLLNQSPS
ncbi:MAG: TetR/AcrR family transcriptional regulator [Candidatus Thorarchaeota archaeon]